MGKKVPVPESELPRKEMRALFVATAFNLDWPTKRNLSAKAQQKQIDWIIERAVEAKYNAIILQERSFGDRLYRTDALPSEPWSNVLNLKQDPGYDPLGTWIKKCHDAGLQLHAWVNPYRTNWPIPYKGNPLPLLADHDKLHLYLDPTDPLVREYLVEVVLRDLLNYTASLDPMHDGPAPKGKKGEKGTGDDDDGVDGIVVDHYVPDGGGKSIEEAKASGKRTVPTLDQIRDGHKAFVLAAFNEVKNKNRVFTMSPSIAQKAWATEWLNPPLCHYIIPELYSHPGDFGSQLQEWVDELNKIPGGTPRPVLVAGLYTARTQRPEKGQKPWSVSEILDEVQAAKGLQVGQAHYSYVGMRSQRRGGPADNVGDHLKKVEYQEVSLITPHDDQKLPDISASAAHKPGVVKVEQPDRGRVRVWIYRVMDRDGNWSAWKTLSGKEPSISVGMVTKVQVFGVDRHNRSSDVQEVIMPQ